MSQNLAKEKTCYKSCILAYFWTVPKALALLKKAPKIYENKLSGNYFTSN